MTGIRIGPKGVPPANRTLGYDILGWTADYLLQPDGPNAGQPWEFTPEQVRFILNWYAIDDLGRFVYRSGMLRRMKGWGKDPMGAVLCAVEFVGPCRFGGWNPDGTPIVVPHPMSWVQTAAVSLEQTKNTMSLFSSLFSQRAITEYGIDLGKTLLYAGPNGRNQLQALTSSPRTSEGPRVTFILKNSAGSAVSSGSGTCSYVTGSKGCYIGVLEDVVSLTENNTYYLELTATASNDRIGFRRITYTAKYHGSN